MPSRAMDTDEYPQIHTQPVRISSTTVSTAMVTREDANLSNDKLQERERCI